MFHRGFRGGRRRSIPRPFVKTYKKVLKFAPASFAAGFNNQFFATGVDSIALGQTGPIDPNVPTGTRIRWCEIQFSASNVVSTACYVVCTIQYVLSGQTFVNPDNVGGDPQRNQVLHQELFSIGSNQSSTHKFRFKVPKKFQRIREGMSWAMTFSNNVTINNTTLMIYKAEM